LLKFLFFEVYNQYNDDAELRQLGRVNGKLLVKKRAPVRRWPGPLNCPGFLVHVRKNWMKQIMAKYIAVCAY
jgi:hypothetical protein